MSIKCSIRLGLFLFIASLTATHSVAAVRLPKVIAEHMVIQQKQPTPIWGWASPGEEVNVKLSDSAVKTTADDQGRWMVKLDPPVAGGPYKLQVKGAENSVSIEDILVGEVWVCSGQSNMQWSVKASKDPQKEIASADHPKIRLFTVQRKVSKDPLDDCNGSWSVCSPQTISGFSAVAYFFGRELQDNLDVPVGLINTSWGGTICEAWTSRPTLKSDKDFQPILDRAVNFRPKNPNQASVLYNGMIKPLLPLSIRGAIWYQGESNISRSQQYHKLFPAMIADWRKNWGQGEFPFLFVQLAPYRYGRQNPEFCAELREAQFQTLKVPNTGMAVTTDIGNTKDIHPKNKQEVGRRLALWALANTYDKRLVFSGPLYKSMKIEGSKIRLAFSNVGGGLHVKGDRLTHFTIAGDDEKFVPAIATIDGNSVIVSSDKVAKSTAVRFGWRDDAEPNLFNQEGLPASPFRTDRFKLLTADAK